MRNRRAPCGRLAHFLGGLLRVRAREWQKTVKKAKKIVISLVIIKGNSNKKSDNGKNRYVVKYCY